MSEDSQKLSDRQRPAPRETAAKEIDTEILTRLTDISCRPVKTSPFGSAWFWRLMRIPAAAFLVLMVILLFALMNYKGSAKIVPHNHFGDLALLNSPDTPEFFSHLHFYAWLARNTRNHTGTHSDNTATTPTP